LQRHPDRHKGQAGGDVSGGSNPFFNPDWLDIQRRYLESLTGGLGSPAGAGEDAAPWSRAVEQWWQTVLSQVPKESQSLFHNILHQSLSFSSMSGPFARLLNAMAEAGADGGDDWQSVLHRHIKRMQEQFHHIEAGAAQDQWHSALKTWQMMLPDELMQGMGGEALREMAERFQALPAVGPAGGYVAMLQECMRLWQDYRERCTQYHNVFRRLGRDALDRLEQRILHLAREGGRITSLRELYNLWVDCNEEVFSEYAASEEYAMLYGELLADFMAFRRKSREMMDTTLRQLDLPTRESLLSVQRDQHELHRQLRQSLVQQQRTRAELEAVQAELDTLRRGKGKKTKKKTKNKTKTKTKAKTAGATGRRKTAAGRGRKTGRGGKGKSR
jgi:class III poly(R)-hydroxyalkanoic acid synthase PhaE subunit